MKIMKKQEIGAPVKVSIEVKLIPEKIYPRLVPGSRIQVIATAKIYDVVFDKKNSMYEFVHENFYQNVFKTELQVANLIMGRKLIIIENADGNAWACIRGPSKKKEAL